MWTAILACRGRSGVTWYAADAGQMGDAFARSCHSNPLRRPGGASPAGCRRPPSFMPPIDRTFPAETLRAFRAWLGLSQEDVASILGISTRSVQAYEAQDGPEWMRYA